MTESERGFLLLCCDLGDGMKPLSLHQLELLRRRMTAAKLSAEDSTVITPKVLQSLGYSEKAAMRLSSLLEREKELDAYLALGAEKDCYPLTCVSSAFPQSLRVRLGSRCPAVLFYRGNLSLLQSKRISLTGSRQLKEQGSEFARQVAQLAAAEGYTLISGNAKGADKTAQEVCRMNGGSVIAVVSEPLCEAAVPDDRILYLAESGWHQEFTAERALSRNRLIYALAEKSFVAQCAVGSGTMQGAEDALKHGIATVFVHEDGSAGAAQLAEKGAIPVRCSALEPLCNVQPPQTEIFGDFLYK